MPDLDALEALLEGCLLADQARLSRRLRRLRRVLATGERRPSVRVLDGVRADLERSRGIRARRAAAAPSIAFPAGLPISAHAAAIGELVERHPVVVVSGATGCGKSTQLPKLCLALGRGTAGRIGHTQPRRIAARAIARRVADETGTVAGELVGHCVRFDDNLTAAARVKVMTDGILLNEIQTDRWLLQYDTLIIDEVHERSLNVEFLIGYLKRVLARRRDLKVILTSATFDASVFAEFFADAAVYAIPDRSHPVEVRYRPPVDADGEERDINETIVDAIAELDAATRGDVLVFLPGEREIREAAAHLRKTALQDSEVLQLYARLGVSQQARVFEPCASRRVILATNVAETSLTVPGVRHVIDSGLARVSRYNPRRKLQQLPLERIAQANADQRAGRCGREAPGICIRLYGEADYERRRASIEPEIQRTNLGGVILRLKAMGIPDIESFPFAEQPAGRLQKDGYLMLQEIGALDVERELTPLGRRLVRFPIDPRLARVLVAGAELDCLAECLVITAGLSIVDPRERPHELRDAADRAHATFVDRRSDFLWFVKAWPYVRELVTWPSKRQRRACRRRFLSAARVHEWVELHDYLARLVAESGLSVNAQPATYRAIHTAIAAGFPSHVGARQDVHYAGCRNEEFRLHPASSLGQHGPRWVVAAEIVETRRRYARIAGRIEPGWLPSAAPHLIKRTYEVPYWDERRGAAQVTEIQRLYGLVVNDSRRVDFARVDAAGARKMFIEHGLVDGELGLDADFLRHNLALMARIRELEARARRRDLLAPRDVLSAFYEERIPAGIASRRGLVAWLRETQAHGRALLMEETDATSGAYASVARWLFPDRLDLAGTECPLTYRFEPGAPLDGVSVEVPAALLPRLQEHHVDRLVPGLLSEKVEHLLRGLPKALRRRIAPVREFAMACVEALAAEDGPLTVAVARVLERMTGTALAAADFREQDLPVHLLMHVRVVDADGCELAAGRGLTTLRSELEAPAVAARAAIDWGLPSLRGTHWCFGDIARVTTAMCGTAVLAGYPALVDEGRAVSLAVFDTRAEADSRHLDGVARLLVCGASAELKTLGRALPGSAELALLAAKFGHVREPLGLLARTAARQWCATRGSARNADEFGRLLAGYRAHVADGLTGAATALLGLFRRGAAIHDALASAGDGLPAAALDDIRSQVMALLGPRVADLLHSEGGAACNRYFDAIVRRFERLQSNPGKDLRKLEQIAPLWHDYLAHVDPSVEPSADEQAAHLLLEEYRIALFAPELGVAGRISRERVEARIAALRPAC